MQARHAPAQGRNAPSAPRPCCMLHVAHTHHPATGQTPVIGSLLQIETQLSLVAGMLAQAERLTILLPLPVQVTQNNTS